jgi:hypothetical protein
MYHNHITPAMRSFPKTKLALIGALDGTAVFLSVLNDVPLRSLSLPLPLLS